MTDKKNKSGWKTFIAIWIIIAFTAAILIFVYAGSKEFFSEDKGNQTDGNVTEVHYHEGDTIINKPGEKNWADASILIAFWLGFFVLLGLLIHYLYKLFINKKISSDYYKNKCMKVAIKELKEEGYEFAKDYYKSSNLFYGGGEQKNLGWGFVFVKKGENFFKNLTSIPKYNLISCFVVGKPIQVTGESDGRDLEDLEEHLRLLNFGKKGQPYFPVKTEKEETLFDSLNPSRSSLNIGLGEGADQQ